MLVLTAILASAGDRDPVYRGCVEECTVGCGQTWRPTWSSVGWSCASDCEYGCMHARNAERLALGRATLQYNGKWPFVRVLGMQEACAVAFSLANLAAHASGLRRSWSALRAAGRRRAVWREFGVLAVHGWAWAALFHARDLRWTERGDYFSAILFILAGLFTAVLHVLDASGVRNAVLVWLLRALCAGGFAAHARTMTRSFDYGRHMLISFALGAVHALTWVAWWTRARRTSATAWRGVALNALAYASAAFELLDFPPILGLLDAHALWHASTAPLGHLLWVYFVEVDGVPPDDQTAALES